jgi:hypothetical protein
MQWVSLCLAESRGHAARLVTRLRESGAASDMISVLLATREATEEFASMYAVASPPEALQAALGPRAVGWASNAVAGALIGLGLPEPKGLRYTVKVSGGQPLISVCATAPEQQVRVARALRDGRGEEVYSITVTCEPGWCASPASSRSSSSSSVVEGRREVRAS